MEADNTDVTRWSDLNEQCQRHVGTVQELLKRLPHTPTTVQSTVFGTSYMLRSCDLGILSETVLESEIVPK